MTSTTGTTVISRAHVESVAHYRTTFTSAAEAPVYIRMANGSEEIDCSHPSAIELTRFGYADCSQCGATMWSLRWLAEGVYGPGTPAWGDDTARFFREAMAAQGVVTIDGAERRIVAAMRIEQDAYENGEPGDHLARLVTGNPSATLESVRQGAVDELVAETALTPLADLLGAMPVPVAEPSSETVSAMLNPDVPANTRRSGIPVPHMDMIEPDWHPEPVA